MTCLLKLWKRKFFNGMGKCSKYNVKEKNKIENIIVWLKLF